MLIVCPTCDTPYQVDAAKLGAAGRSVRCARCRTLWLVEPAPEPVAAAACESEIEQAIAPPGADTRLGDRDVLPANATPEAGPEAEAPQHATTADAPAPVIEAPPIAPSDRAPETLSRFDPADAPPEDIETIAARGAQLAGERRARRRWPRAGLPLAILVLAAIVTSLVGWRSQVVRAAPQSARLYAAIGLPVNLRGLAFEGVKSADEIQDGVPVLVVTGDIVNVTNATVTLPRLRFAVRNAAGMEIYAWTALPSEERLPAGQTLPFRSRLASPPAGSHDVAVRFFHRRDLAGGP